MNTQLLKLILALLIIYFILIYLCYEFRTTHIPGACIIMVQGTQVSPDEPDLSQNKVSINYSNF